MFLSKKENKKREKRNEEKKKRDEFLTVVTFISVFLFGFGTSSSFCDLFFYINFPKWKLGFLFLTKSLNAISFLSVESVLFTSRIITIFFLIFLQKKWIGRMILVYFVNAIYHLNSLLLLLNFFVEDDVPLYIFAMYAYLNVEFSMSTWKYGILRYRSRLKQLKMILWQA